jgi:excisionase family DNA binding protein
MFSVSGSTRSDVLTTLDVARLCGVSRPTVVRWIEGGKLEAYRTPGGHRRVRQSALQTFCREQGVPLVSAEEGHRPVLVVDDEPYIRSAMVKLLQRLAPEIPVLAAEDAFQASKLVARHTPALVFLDLRLPGMDGFTFLEHIRTTEVGRATQVVAISGLSDRDLHLRTERAGFAGLLRKPFTSAAVERLLDELQVR